MKQEIFKCDIYGCEAPCDDKIIKVTVVFTTDQTEGRGVSPYLSLEKLNLCEEHLNEILIDGKMIFAEGAMGYNNYYFKS